MTGDEQAIRRLVADWMAGVRDGDAGKVLDLIDDDALFLTADSKPFGKDAFRAHSSEQRDTRIEPVNNIEEIEIAGNWAYMRSSLRVTVTPSSGKPVRRSGHALTILRKGSDGRWRVFRDANLLTVEDQG
jgi:uncharacterized protein (TIGR02246 family)